MALQIARLKTSVFVVIVFSALATQVAMAQQTEYPPECNAVAENIRTVSAALGVCEQVVNLHQKIPLTADVLLDPAAKSDYEILKEKTDEGLENITQAKVFQLQLENRKHKYRDFLLKTSAYIIGGVAAGLGGSLRLGGHNTAGTYVTAIGGSAGASVNLFALACPESDKIYAKQGLDELSNSSQFLKSYMNPNFKSEQFCKDPTAFSPTLTTMTNDVMQLRKEFKVTPTNPATK